MTEGTEAELETVVPAGYDYRSDTDGITVTAPVSAALARRIEQASLRDTGPLGAEKVRRHPAQVTVDRLNDHLEAFADQLTPRELSAAGRVILALEAIAAGDR